MSHAWAGKRTRVGGVTGERANHYTTALSDVQYVTSINPCFAYIMQPPLGVLFGPFGSVR